MTSWIAENQSELIIIIIGIGLGILIYYFRFYRKRVFYCTTSFNLVKTNSTHYTDSNKLKILFGNNEISDLTVTHIAFWNGGKETINKSDIVSPDEPRIELKNANEIYEIEILNQSEISNDFRLTQIDKNSYTLTFDHVGKSQGCVIKILQSGSVSEDINITGEIKGIGSIKKRKPKNSFYVWPLAIAVIDILDGMFFNFGTYNIITFLLTVYGYIVLIILSPVFFSNWKNILPEDIYKSFVSEN